MSEDKEKSVIRPDVENFEKGKRSDGTRFIDNGDDVSQELRELTLDEAFSMLNRELKESGEKSTIKALKEKYEHLNPGMQRMVIGNRLRGLRSKAEKKAA